jgi:hypothetical protein
MKDSYDRDEYLAIMTRAMADGTPETDRAMAMWIWAHSSVGRSDDVRAFYAADLIAPQLIPAVGRWKNSVARLLQLRVRHVPGNARHALHCNASPFWISSHAVQ